MITSKSKNMKVLQFISALSKGGAERMVVEISNELDRRGHSVSLLVGRKVDPELNENSLNANISIQHLALQKLPRIAMYLKMLDWVVHNRKTIKSYDVIHCHLNDGLILALLMRLMIFRHRPKFVFTCHLVGMNAPLIVKIANVALIGIFDNFVLMATDKFWEKFIFFGERRISVVSNGINFTDSTIVRRHSEIESETGKVVGTISRLSRERSPWIFLDLFSKISNLDKSQNTSFAIAGDGPEGISLKRRLEASHQGDRINFAGLIKNSEDFLKNIDVYVALNVGHRTGIAGLEAIRFGIPVVGIQLSRTYLASDSDWIWSATDLDSVATKVIEILTDSEMAKKLAEKQYLHAYNEYSVVRMSAQYLELYEN
jgi:glycosyltransferase involved in cell wall biosynthesis